MRESRVGQREEATGKLSVNEVEARTVETKPSPPRLLDQISRDTVSAREREITRHYGLNRFRRRDIGSIG